MDQYNVLSLTTNIDELERDMDAWNMLTYDEKKVANDYCMQRYNMTNENLYNYIKATIFNKAPINSNDNGMISDRNENITVSEASMMNTLNEWRYFSTIQPLNEIEITVDDEDLLPPSGYKKNGTINGNFEKIQRANDAVKEDGGDIVIINDFLDDYHMDYTIDDLEAKFNKYNYLSYDHKMESDTLSVDIWGRDIPNMYNYMKAKILSMSDPLDKKIDIEISPVDKELNNFKLDLIKAQQDHDIVENLRRKAQVLSNKDKRSLYENAVLEGFFDKIKVNGKTYRQGMPEVTPFLTYDEYVNNPRCLDEKRINFVDPFTYVMNFKDKEHKIKEEIMEAYNNNDIDTLLSLGWNPVVEPTAENFKYARERQIKWMDEFCAIEIYDISKLDTDIPKEELDFSIQEANNMGKDLAPVYLVCSYGCPRPDIVFTTVKHTSIDKKTGNLVITKNMTKSFTPWNEFWSSPGIAFEPKLNNIYYYLNFSDTDLNLMAKSNLKGYVSDAKGGELAVMVFFVPTAVRKKLMHSVDHFFLYQNSGSGNFKNYEGIPGWNLVEDTPRLFSTNLDFVCGQFMNSIFKIADIQINQIYTNTTAKVSTSVSEKRSHMIMLYRGSLINYSAAKVESKTNALLAFNDYMDLTFFKKGLDLRTKSNNLAVRKLEEAFINTDNDEVNKILRELRYIFTARDFLEGANISISLEDYKNKIKEIDLQLSECTHREVDKIQHFINEIHNIKSILASKTNVDCTLLIEDIDCICNKYRTIFEGGKV